MIMDAKGLRTLKSKILVCLEIHPETRNCDIALTCSIWKEFYREHLTYADFNSGPPYRGKLVVELEKLSILPREDHIKRIRAVIQNKEGQYLPTIWDVAKQRGINEEKWKKALGYYINNKNQFVMEFSL